MTRLVFFAVVLIGAFIIWIAKQVSGELTGNREYRQTTFKQQTRQTMDSVARGINWLEEQWDDAKQTASRDSAVSGDRSVDPPEAVSKLVDRAVRASDRCPRCGFAYGWHRFQGGLSCSCSHCGYEEH